MVRHLLAIGALMLSATPLWAQSRTNEVEAVGDVHAVDKSTQTEDVRFMDVGHERMTVPVRLSGTGPYRFLIDTGSQRTV